MTLRGLVLLALVTPASCYTVGDLYENRKVQVRIFDNATERHAHEFDLTQAVSREMASKGLRVNTPGAPVTLEGMIIDLRTPAAVSGDLNTVVVGSLLVRLQIRLLNADGKEIWKDERSESVAFTTSRGQSFDSARAEAFDRLARWIVTHFEKEW